MRGLFVTSRNTGTLITAILVGPLKIKQAMLYTGLLNLPGAAYKTGIHVTMSKESVTHAADNLLNFNTVNN